MIFSESEREHYRKELGAASNAGDLKRVKRLIDQIRLLGDLRENASKMGIGEKEVNEKFNEKFDEHSALNYPDENPFGLLPAPEDILGDDDIVGLHYPPEVLDVFSVFKDKAEKFLVYDRDRSFHDVLRLGFTEAGWTW